ncbi:MFS transporter [Paraburkholderia sp.]|uniref:MFS transporter n=1 Tax=Paraburkholderia sp. TaxID=1926495 RepID=UPI0025CD5B9B|nr:MFS transporter [Paraburkholderia sp.]
MEQSFSHIERDEKNLAGVLRSRIAGCIGHGIEWFDFSIYANLAIFFSGQLFPGDSKGAKLLAAFGVYALGFVMRPLGGWLLGVLADRRGRRSALSLSVQLMAFGSLLLAVVPTYNQIGFAAPIVATIARLLQGLSTGGEFAAAITFLGETAPSNKRGLHGSFLFFGTGIGLMCASGIVWLLNGVLTHDQMMAFGWRIPFVIAAISGIYAWWLRRNVAETRIFEEARAAGKRKMGSLRELFTNHRKQVLTLIGICICGTFAFYLFAVYVPVYAIQRAGATPSIAYAASSFSLLIYTAVHPFFGMLSDRIGRRPQMLFCAACYTVFLYPVVLSVQPTFWSIAGIELFGLVLYALFSSIVPATLSEMFKTEIRTVGIGLPINIVIAVLGGTTPFLMTWLQSMHLDNYFLIYVSAGSFITLVTVWRMKETNGCSLTD